MKKIIQLLNPLRNVEIQPQGSVKPICNYPNNYYGDQVCLTHNSKMSK